MGGSSLDRAYEDRMNAELDAEFDARKEDYLRRNPPAPPEPTPPAAGDTAAQGDRPTTPSTGGLEKLLAADDRREKKRPKPYSEGDQFSSLMSGDLGAYYDKTQISKELSRLYAERKANGSAVSKEDLISLAESNYAQRQAMVAQIGKDLPGLGKSGLAAGASGLMSATGMFAEAVGDKQQADELYASAAGLKGIAETSVETPDNAELAGLYDGIRSFAMAAPAATIAWKTKRPEVMLDFMFGAAAGDANLDIREKQTYEGEQKFSLAERLTYSVAQGLAERVFEMIPAQKLFGSAPGKSPAKRFFETLAAEIPGEQGTLAANKFLEWRVLNPNVPVEEYYATYPQEAYQTFVATIVGTVLNNAGVLALDTAEQGLTKGLESLKTPPAEGEPGDGAPPPETPPADGETPAPKPAPAAEPAATEAAPKITIGELADQANEAIEELAAQFQEPETETSSQKFLRGVESAFGMNRPAPAAQPIEERRAAEAERMATERQAASTETQRVVDSVRSFVQTRAAAESSVTRAIETPEPAAVVEAVIASNELAAETDAPPISLAEEMDIDTTDRTSTLAEAERIAGELEAMDSDEAKSSASAFRTLIQYSDKYDDNTFWQGFDEALEYAAPYLMTEAQQAAIVEKVEAAVEAAPLAPEEQAAATIVEEARAAAPASKYFGLKSFRVGAREMETPEPAAAPEAATGNIETDVMSAATAAAALGSANGPMDWRPIRAVRESLRASGYSDQQINDTLKKMYRDGAINLSTQDDQGSLTDEDRAASFVMGQTRIDLIAPTGSAQAPAPVAAAEPAPATQPARLPPKPAPISKAQLAEIDKREGKISKPVQARETMALKAEDVYDDILTKDVLEELDDRHNMDARTIRNVMGKALDGQGSLDRFNTLMKRYAKVRADLDRKAAETPVQADFEALAAAQPDPGEGGLGRGLSSLLEEQGVNPETKFSKGERKPVADPEKNRKRLDARGFRDWGQNYLDLVQKGQVTFASADEIAAMGFPGNINAVTIPGPNSETVINTSIVRPEHLEGILLHEVGVHRGLQGLMGDTRFEEVLMSLDRLVEGHALKMQRGQRATPAEAAAMFARLKAQRLAANPNSQKQVREETLAYIVEDHVSNPLIPTFITQIKVAIGRRYPGIIERLGWGSAEYAQLALVSLRRFVIKDIKHVPNNRAMPGYRSPRAPYLLQVTYPEGFRGLARERGSATTPQGWFRRLQTMGQTQMWRAVRTIDLRDVNGFPQALKDLERDLTSPEVFQAFFGMDPAFDWENYLDLYALAKEGDPDAAFDVSAALTKLKGMNVPVNVQFSANDARWDTPGTPAWEAAKASGLDMGAAARKARGAEAGFNMDETLYHGTAGNIVEFDLDRSGESAGTPGERAIFLSTSPTEASVYARNAAVAKNGPGTFGSGANMRGSNVLPLVVRPGNQLRVNVQTHPELKPNVGDFMLYRPSVFSDIIEQARAEGYDTVRFENVLDSAKEPADQIAVLNPADIRSVNAVFDPAQRQSANVMFSRNLPPEDNTPDVDPAIEEVYFNYVRFGDPDTVYPTIREALKSVEVSERMGPVETQRQVEIDAGNTNAFEALLKSRKGQTLSRPETLALRNLHKYSALKVHELAQLAAADPNDKSLEAAVMRAAIFHRGVLAEVKGQTAEAARTLGALRIQAKATAAVASAVDSMLDTGNQTGDLKKMIRDLAGMDAKQIKNINKRVEMTTWKAWQDLAGTWLRAMYLSMPSTHIVNAVGNVTTMLGSVADHHIGGRLTMDPDLVEESFVRFNGIVEGFVHQFEYMRANSQLNPLKPNTSLNFDKEGVSGADRWEGGNERALSASRLELLTGGLVKASPDDPIGRMAEVIGYALAAPSEALGVSDDLFKGTNYRMSLRGQAFRKAREERRAGKITEAQEAQRAEELFQWPTEEMVKQGITEAQENTFTRPVGGMTRGVMSMRQWMNEKTGVMGWLTLPFIITPSNLMSFRFRRMPTAPLFEEWRQSYAKGGKDRAVAMAQVVNGTSLLAFGGALFGAGLMTGLGPDDPDKRKALMDTGWKPLAMNVNGLFIETNRLDPLMMPFHIAAGMAEVFANDGWNTDPSDEAFELMAMSAIKFGQMMLDKSYMSGLANIVESFAGATNTRGLESWFNRSVAGATTPALMAGVRRMEDPFKRQAFSIIEQMRNRTPVFSKTLPQAYDVFGSEVVYQEGFLSAAQLFNPFGVSKEKDEPIYQELRRLKYVPDPMLWKISVPYAGNSVTVDLRERPDIYSDMTRMIGGDEEYGIPDFRELLNQLVTDENYQDLADINNPTIKGSKAQAISNMMERARSASRQVILDRYWPDLQDLAKKQFGAEVELAKVKEGENQAAAATEAYQLMLEQAK